MDLIKIIKEEVGDIHDYNELFGETFRDILMQMLNKDKTKIALRKIKPSMYQQALNEFMKYGEINRYPVKYIYDWKNIIINNFVYLDVITMFFGHTSYFDIDTFNVYVFNTDETGESVKDWSEAMEYIEENGYDEILDAFLPQFSNGHDLISDYGLEPLKKIVEKLINTDDPNEILVLINKALDVSHQRSDLSELFIEGGEASLARISGLDENLNVMNKNKLIKIIKEEIENDFLNHKKIAEDEKDYNLISDKTFQKQFILDSILNMSSKIKKENLNLTVNEYDESEDSMDFSYNGELQYNYNGEPVIIILGIENDIPKLATSKGDKINFSEFNNAPSKIQEMFLNSYINKQKLKEKYSK